jgi:hypothetical protein
MAGVRNVEYYWVGFIQRMSDSLRGKKYMASYLKKGILCVYLRETKKMCSANFAVILDDLGDIKHIRKCSFMD